MITARLACTAPWIRRDGGNTNRYSFSSNLWNKGDNWKNDANIYALYYDVNLFSNFTGYLDNPVNGDQIHQFEHRVQTGGNIEHTRYNKLFGFDMDNTFGLQFRHDEIMDLGLDHTLTGNMSTRSVTAMSVRPLPAFISRTRPIGMKKCALLPVYGVILSITMSRCSTTATHDPHVNAANSGTSRKAMVSPKLSLIIGPWYNTEYFVNAGYGYHSNDARGTTSTT